MIVQALTSYIWEKKTPQRHGSASPYATQIEAWHSASKSCWCLGGVFNEDTKVRTFCDCDCGSASVGFSLSPKLTRVSERPVRIRYSDSVHRREGTIVQSLAEERKPVKTKKYEEDCSYSLLHQPFGHSHLNVCRSHKNYFPGALDRQRSH